MADVSLAIASGPSGANFSKLAVVKELRSEAAEDPEIVAMFLDEARILAQLRHPNVVQIIEVGLQRDGKAFFAMEYLDGLSLRRLRSRAKRAGVAVGIDVEVVALVQVLRGLDHAHEAVSLQGHRLDIVHRDVTPHNVIATVDGHVKVLDFGIAKSALSVEMTAHGVVKGKLRYMSPEQARGRGTIGTASDIFSVGVMLWEAATRRRFWAHVDDADVAVRLLGNAFDPSPRAIDPTVHEALDAVCRRALAFVPEQRYPTARAMGDDLEAFLDDRVVVAQRELATIVQVLAHSDRTRLRSLIEPASRVHDESVERGPARDASELRIADSRGVALHGGGIPLRPSVVAVFAAAMMAGVAAACMALAAHSADVIYVRESPAQRGEQRAELSLSSDGVTRASEAPVSSPNAAPPRSLPYTWRASPRRSARAWPSSPVPGLDLSDPWLSGAR